MKVLIATTHSGFRLNADFLIHLIDKGINIDDPVFRKNMRHDQKFIRIAEEYGLDKIGAERCRFELADVPDGAQYKIADYDNVEYIDSVWVEFTREQIMFGLKGAELKLAMSVGTIKIKKDGTD